MSASSILGLAHLFPCCLINSSNRLVSPPGLSDWHFDEQQNVWRAATTLVACKIWSDEHVKSTAPSLKWTKTAAGTLRRRHDGPVSPGWFQEGKEWSLFEKGRKLKRNASFPGQLSRWCLTSTKPPNPSSDLPPTGTHSDNAPFWLSERERKIESNGWLFDS